MILEEDLCSVKIRVMDLKPKDIEKSPFYECFICDGYNFNCVEFKEVENEL